MPSLPRSELLLHTICDLIEDPDEAARIRALDPSSDLTFAEAYCAVRHLPTLTPELRQALMAEIFDRADRETERQLEARSRAGGSKKPTGGGADVIPLHRRRRVLRGPVENQHS